MGALIVQHRVKDFKKWRKAYDAHAPARRKAGLTSAQVYRGTDDPHKVAIVFKVKDVERAKAFGESDDLKKVMKAAGVIGKPVIILVGESSPQVGVEAGGG
jgi:heme-degrading monooxygenase HmoA